MPQVRTLYQYCVGVNYPDLKKKHTFHNEDRSSLCLSIVKTDTLFRVGWRFMLR